MKLLDIDSEHLGIPVSYRLIIGSLHRKIKALKALPLILVQHLVDRATKPHPLKLGQSVGLMLPVKAVMK